MIGLHEKKFTSTSAGSIDPRAHCLPEKAGAIYIAPGVWHKCESDPEKNPESGFEVVYERLGNIRLPNEIGRHELPCPLAGNVNGRIQYTVMNLLTVRV